MPNLCEKIALHLAPRAENSSVFCQRKNGWLPMASDSASISKNYLHIIYSIIATHVHGTMFFFSEFLTLVASVLRMKDTEFL